PSSSYRKEITVTAQGKLRMVARLMYYPGWHLYSDGEQIPLLESDNGTVMFDVTDGGEHQC
ncbi:MAG: hypothetical protein K6T59_04200, partial [Bryobacteraceae bacterium]|nr:hypothetical protein [Bryobacteraceae bacterium]